MPLTADDFRNIHYYRLPSAQVPVFTTALPLTFHFCLTLHTLSMTQPVQIAMPTILKYPETYQKDASKTHAIWHYNFVKSYHGDQIGEQKCSTWGRQGFWACCENGWSPNVLLGRCQDDNIASPLRWLIGSFVCIFLGLEGRPRGPMGCRRSMELHRHHHQHHRRRNM